jgi:KipI family sensor histidine kinase inhibitor
MTRRLLDYGADAVLLECADLAEVRALRPAVEQEFDQVWEIVPGARTLLLRLQAPLTSAERQRLLTLAPVDEPAADHEVVSIQVDYSGADLAEVAERTGLTPNAVVAAHTGQVWTVAFCGFAPGFGYLVGEDDRLRVPRRDQPRTSVPAGAVGLADAFSGIYPRPGPGGWQLIGRTDATLWDLDRDPPALLRPGVRVRFAATART